MRVVLPSNASLKNFPNNSLTKYSVQLPQSIKLSSGDWEVGIAEIQFSRSWCNALNLSFRVFISPRIFRNVIIDDGYYESELELINHINTKITKHPNLTKNDLLLSLDKSTRKCSIRHKGSVALPKKLRHILGFQENYTELMASISGSTVTIIGNSPMALDTITNIMVYSDIVQANFVGDVEAPLLRSIAITSKHGEVQCTSFNRIQYLPVSRRDFRTISLYICTDYGEPVPFTTGRTVVTLDFRQVKARTF